MTPRWGHTGAKRAPERAKTSQDRAQIGHLEPPRKTLKKGSPEPLRFGPQNCSKTGSKNYKNTLRFLTSFGIRFGPLLEPFWEPVWTQDRPRRRQEEPKRAHESSKKRNKLFSKKWFSHRPVYTFLLLKPPKTVPRGPENWKRAS